MTSAAVDTVIFDLGGVLARNGRPKDIAKRYPDHHPDTVMRVLMGDYGTDSDHPWHRLERGEISLAEHRELTGALLIAAGIEPLPVPAPGTPRMRFEPNAPVVDLVNDLRSHGVRLGVLTNNVREFRPLWWDLLPFDDWFDDIVDSHEVGLRKPDPAIYQLALGRLGAVAERTAFLDDVATNVDAATRVGIVGVLVDDDPLPAVATVRALVGLNRG
ncbi:MAG: HAD family phosphatase [Actinomycetota bacterium]